MNSEQLIIEKLIEKFRFDEPISFEIRNYISASKERNLKAILKKEGRYSLFTGLTLLVFLLARKAGLTLSFIQATAVTVTATIMTTAIVVTGSVTGVNYVIEKNRAEKESSLPVIETPVEEHTETSLTPVSLFGFSGTKDTASVARLATDIIYNRLVAVRGEGNVFLASAGSRKGYHVTGSVEKIPAGFSITVKTVNPVNGVIIDIETTEIHSEEELYSACSGIVKKISKSIK